MIAEVWWVQWLNRALHPRAGCRGKISKEVRPSLVHAERRRLIRKQIQTLKKGQFDHEFSRGFR